MPKMAGSSTLSRWTNPAMEILSGPRSVQLTGSCSYERRAGCIVSARAQARVQAMAVLKMMPFGKRPRGFSARGMQITTGCFRVRSLAGRSSIPSMPTGTVWSALRRISHIGSGVRRVSRMIGGDRCRTGGSRLQTARRSNAISFIQRSAKGRCFSICICH